MTFDLTSKPPRLYIDDEESRIWIENDAASELHIETLTRIFERFAKNVGQTVEVWSSPCQLSVDFPIIEPRCLATFKP